MWQVDVWVVVAWALGVDTTCEIMKSTIDVWLPMKGTECINALVLDGLNVKTSSKILSKARLKRVNLSGCALVRGSIPVWHTS